MLFRRGIAAGTIVSAIIVGGGGCSHTQKGNAMDGTFSQTTPAQQYALISGTTQLMTMAYAKVVAVTGDAAAASKSRDIQEDSLRFRINAVNRLDSIRAMPDMRVRFVALWVFIVQAENAFTTGFSKDRFGAVQDMYVTALKDLDAQAQEVANRALPADVAKSVRPEIERLARNPQIATTDDFAAQANRTIGRILAIPLAPVTGLQGVGDTPAAINRFTDQAGDIGKVVENLPERTRWQFELFLLEAQENGAVATALQDVDKIIAEIQELRKEFVVLSSTAQKVPDQVNNMLQEVLKRQPELAQDLDRIENSMKLANQAMENADKTVATVNTAIVGAQATVESVRKALGDVDKSAVALGSTAREVRGLIEDIKLLSPPPTTQEAALDAMKKQQGGGDDWTPKNISDAAVQIKSTAAELRSLLADIKSPTQLTGVEQTAQRMEGILYKAIWGVAGLIVFFFACLLGYRAITRRIEAK